MAIFIVGMNCSVCRQPMNDSSLVTMFSPFTGNEADRLYPFSDAAMHTACFQAHPLHDAARTRYAEALQHGKREKRCHLCQTLIATHTEYFGFGYLVDDVAHPLRAFNYAEFHLACLSKWDQLRDVINELELLQQSGKWDGVGPRWMIQDLRSKLD